MEDDAASPPASDPGAGRVPARIGPYRLLDTLGEGGMGTVYLAEQDEPVKRRVALKLIKLGMDSKAVLARFEQERQALALMQHDGIARVHDCGTSERGQPYFVMEYVRGVPLTDYCERHRLPLAARLELMMQVCAAVQHAHHKGVVHRDLKPGNVLVADDGGRPQVKIIDFGLAKAMGQRLVEATLFTEAGQVVGTPEYMAPEQADPGNHDIDTRADVYSLGVLLYEVLTGALPFSGQELRRAGVLEMQRLLREVDPPRPSSRLSRAGDAAAVAGARRTTIGALQRALKHDLDWVVLKALEKDRSRRYETASALADDLQRFLASEPLAAGPPSASYRLRKLIARHRAQLLALAAVLLTALGGAGVAIGFAVHADEQRRLATARATETEAALAVAEGHRLALQSTQALDTDRGLATVLAVEAARHHEDDVTRSALVAALAGSTHHETRSLHGHAGCVDLVAIAPRGPFGLTGSQVLPGQPLDRLQGGRPGDRIASPSDGTVRVWNLENGRPQAVLPAHPDGVEWIGFDATGQRCGTCDVRGGVRAFDASDGSELYRYDPPTDGAWSCQFVDAELATAVYVAGDRMLALDLRHGTELAAAIAGPIVTSRDRRHVAWRGPEGWLLWATPRWRSVALPAGLRPWGIGIGARFVVGSDEAAGAGTGEAAAAGLVPTLVVVEVASGRRVATLSAAAGFDPRSVVLSSDGERLLVAESGAAGPEGNAAFWDVASGTRRGSFERLLDGGIGPDGDVVACRDSGFRFFASRSQEELFRATVVSPFSTRIALRDDGGTVTALAASPVGVPRVWTFPHTCWRRPPNAAVAPDGSRQVAFGADSHLADALGRRLARLNVGPQSTGQVCFDPEGRRAAVLFDSGHVCWYEVGSRALVWQRPEGLRSYRVNHVTWTPDGRWFLVSVGDRLEAWDGRQPAQPLWSVGPTPVFVHKQVFAADGNTLALLTPPRLEDGGGISHQGTVIDLSPGVLPQDRIAHRGAIGLSTCGDYVAVGRQEGFAVLDRRAGGASVVAGGGEVQDVEIGQAAWVVVSSGRWGTRVVLRGASPVPTILEVQHARMSPDGTRVFHATGSRAWLRSRAATAPQEIPGLEAPVVRCQWSPRGDRIAVWTGDDRLHVWQVDPLLRLGGGAAPGASSMKDALPRQVGMKVLSDLATWSADGAVLASVQLGSLCWWSEPTPDEVRTWPLDQEVAGCALSADGRLAAVRLAERARRRGRGGTSGALLLSLDSMRQLWQADDPAGVWFAPAGAATILSAPAAVGWFDVRRGELAEPVAGPERKVAAAWFAPDSSRCALEAVGWEVAWAPPCMRLIAAADGRPIAMLPGATVLGWTDDSRWLLTGGRTADAVHCIDASTGTVLGRIDGVVDRVDLLPGHALALVSDRSASARGTEARLCELPGLRVAATLPHLPQQVAAVAVGGSAVAVVCDNEAQVRLFDLRTGAPLRRLEQSEPVTCVAASPDGSLVAAGGGSGRIALFEAATGRLLRRVVLSSQPIREVALAPDGSMVAGLSDHGELALHRTADGGCHWRGREGVGWLRGLESQWALREPVQLAFSTDGGRLQRGGRAWPVHPLPAATAARPRLPTLAEVRLHGLHTPARLRAAVAYAPASGDAADPLVAEYVARERELAAEAGVFAEAREVVGTLAERWIDPVRVRTEIVRLALPDAVRDAALAESMVLPADTVHVAAQVARVLAARPRDAELDRHALTLAERLRDAELIALGLLRVGDLQALRERMQSTGEVITAAGRATRIFYRQLCCVLLAHAFAGEWAEVERLVASHSERVGPEWWATIERVCGTVVRREVEQRGPLDEASLASWAPSASMSAAEQHDARIVARLLVAAWSRTDSLNSVAWDMVLDPDGDTEHYRRSLQLAEAAVRADPRPHVRNTLGVALYRNGRYAEAVDTLLHTGAGDIALQAVAWQPDGSAWWTAGRDRVLRRCTDTQCTEVVALNAGTAAVQCLAVAEHEVWAGTASGLLLRVEAGEVREIARTPQGVHQVLPLAGGAEIAVAHGREVTLVTAATGATRRPMAAGAGPLRLATDGRGTLLLVGDSEGRAVVATTTPHVQRAAVRAGGRLAGVHLASAGDRIVTVRADGEVAEWVSPDWQRRRSFRTASRELTAFAVGPDATVQAFGTATGAIELWHGPESRCLGELAGHRARVTALAFRPDGARLVSTSEDGTARLWDMATLEPLPCPHPPPSLAARDFSDLVFLAMAWHRLGERDRAEQALAELVRRPKPEQPDDEQHRLLREAEQVLRGAR